MLLLQHTGEVEELVSLCATRRPDVALFELTTDAEALVAACRRARPGIHLVALHLGRRTDHEDRASGLGVTLLSYAAPAPAALAAVRHQDEGARPVLAERRRGRTLDAPEREVLQLVGDGLTEAEVAGKVGRSPEEVRQLVARMLDALGEDTIGSAVRLGREIGLVPRLRRAG